LRQVRREVAQVETVLHQRQLATDVAAAEPEIASRLAGKEWQSNARFVYEDSAWQVEFNDKSGKKLATAWVDLNKVKSQGRAAKKPRRIVRHEVSS
jgi:hypothetical protein